jgi:hypothetical protein
MVERDLWARWQNNCSPRPRAAKPLASCAERPIHLIEPPTVIDFD